MTHEWTYLLVCDLIVEATSYEVKPSQKRHLALTQRGSSCVFIEKTDASTRLRVDQQGKNIAAPLLGGTSSTE